MAKKYGASVVLDYKNDDVVKKVLVPLVRELVGKKDEEQWY
jgi:hypothetical protein